MRILMSDPKKTFLWVENAYSVGKHLKPNCFIFSLNKERIKYLFYINKDLTAIPYKRDPRSRFNELPLQPYIRKLTEKEIVDKIENSKIVYFLNRDL